MFWLIKWLLAPLWVPVWVVWKLLTAALPAIVVGVFHHFAVAVAVGVGIGVGVAMLAEGATVVAALISAAIGGIIAGGLTALFLLVVRRGAVSPFGGRGRRGRR
jgi:hypothetical protein